MIIMISTKEEAIEILKKHVKGRSNIDHNLMVGYGLLGLAKLFNKNEQEQNKWFVIGCLHDIDIEKYGTDINKHCVIGEEILQKENIDQEIIDIIKSHNDCLGIERKKEVEHMLYSCDGLTGIIRAYVLMRPDRDITQAKVKSITKKLKDKTFAAAVSREEIRSCEQTLKIETNKLIEGTLQGIKRNMNFNL